MSNEKSLKTQQETDVGVIRNLISENMKIADDIRDRAESLHLNDTLTQKPEPAETSVRVGQEFINGLQDLRRILREAKDALISFNG